MPFALHAFCLDMSVNLDVCMYCIDKLA